MDSDHHSGTKPCLRSIFLPSGIQLYVDLVIQKCDMPEDVNMSVVPTDGGASERTDLHAAIAEIQEVEVVAPGMSDVCAKKKGNVLAPQVIGECNLKVGGDEGPDLEITAAVENLMMLVKFRSTRCDSICEKLGGEEAFGEVEAAIQLLKVGEPLICFGEPDVATVSACVSPVKIICSVKDTLMTSVKPEQIADDACDKWCADLLKHSESTPMPAVSPRRLTDAKANGIKEPCKTSRKKKSTRNRDSMANSITEPCKTSTKKKPRRQRYRSLKKILNET